jgi:DNA-binding LacI/PurR family transcriptional regulator
MLALLQGPQPDAVFCGDDLICMGALDAARSHGLSVPRDIGFLGFNDIAMAGWDAYRLTTIRQPIGDIILASVALATELTEDRERPPAAKFFGCSIVERATLRPLT